MSVTATSEHRHKFKVRYKSVDGQRIMIDPVCQCSGCEQRAVISVDGSRIMVTFVGGNEAQISYTAVLAER